MPCSGCSGVVFESARTNERFLLQPHQKQCVLDVSDVEYSLRTVCRFVYFVFVSPARPRTIFMSITFAIARLAAASHRIVCSSTFLCAACAYAYIREYLSLMVCSFFVVVLVAANPIRLCIIIRSVALAWRPYNRMAYIQNQTNRRRKRNIHRTSNVNNKNLPNLFDLTSLPSSGEADKNGRLSHQPAKRRRRHGYTSHVSCFFCYPRLCTHTHTHTI